MEKHTDLTILKNEYSSKRNSWKDIYQWARIKSQGNTEIISKMLLRDFGIIKWSEKGIRKENFKITNHKGLCAIQTTIKQITEKRLCRALFNKYHNENRKGHPLLGHIIDYETPLTQPNQSKGKISHGDIDLIAKRKHSLLFIEAKHHKSTESLLKALLEIFFYTVSLKKFKRIRQFKNDFQLSYIDQIIPCILIFKGSTSSRQLLNIREYPVFIKLLGQINRSLNENNLGNVEFYMVENNLNNHSEPLRIDLKTEKNNEVKIHLGTELLINRYYPNLCEDESNFETSILNASNEKQVEMLYRSYLTYYPECATKFIITLVQSIEADIREYSNMKPKNTEKAKGLEKELLQRIKYKQAYLKISSCFKNQYFHLLNLQLVDQYNIKDIVPQFSGFKCERTLEKLIDLYDNLRIVRTKDWDGFISKEIDEKDESIIVDALCEYDSVKIIPVLEKSILQGKHKKEKAVRKLLEYKSKSQIYNVVEEYANTHNIFFTDIKEQAQKVIRILDEV